MTYNLEHLEQLEQAATPGPIEYDRWFPSDLPHERGWKVGKGFDESWSDIWFEVPFDKRADAELIVAARNALPSLISLIKEQQAELERLRSVRPND